MFRLWGRVTVAVARALALVATLLADGGDLVVAAARKIAHGLDNKLYACRSTRDERAAILAVLKGPPDRPARRVPGVSATATRQAE